MKENIKNLLIKLALLIGQGATILSGVFLMKLLVIGSGLIPGLDLVALFGADVPHYAELIGVAAGYGILRWLKSLPFLMPVFNT